MSAQKKTPAAKAGAKDSTTRDVSMTAHEEDHAATRAGAKPSIDAESLIRAGLPLIPLHRWDARDAKGRARGKSPIDGAWQSRDYDSREVLAQAERRGPTYQRIGPKTIRYRVGDLRAYMVEVQPLSRSYESRTARRKLAEMATERASAEG